MSKLIITVSISIPQQCKHNIGNDLLVSFLNSTKKSNLIFNTTRLRVAASMKCVRIYQFEDRLNHSIVITIHQDVLQVHFEI